MKVRAKGLWVSAGLLAAIGLTILLAPWPHWVFRSYVAAHPDYFFDRPGFFNASGRSSVLSQLPFDFIDWKLKQAWMRFQADRSAGQPDSNAGRWITDSVAPYFLTQNDVPHPPVATSGVATLVRGFGYCDQINAVLGFALSTRFPESDLFALVDPATDVSPHAVVRVEGPFGLAFADIWQHPHWMEWPEIASTSDHCEAPPELMEYGDSLRRFFQRSTDATAALYCNGRTMGNNRQDLAYQFQKLLNKLRAGALVKGAEPDAAVPRIESPRSSEAREDEGAKELVPPDPDQKRDYLLARYDALWEPPASLKARMAQFAAAHCAGHAPTTVCVAAEHFAATERRP